MRKITVIEPKKATAVRKIRVAAYCRVSTEKSDQANSYETQKSYFMNSYIKAANEEIVEIYADLGSGTSELYRPEFMRMINDCRLGKVDRIVTKSLSRFARNTKDCLTALRELKKLGVTVAFEKEGIDTARVSDEIMITIMEGLAQEESASISRNIRWSLKRRMASGTLGIARVPYGYEKRDGQMTIEESKAAVVQRIYSLYLSGMGAMRIAALFNEENLPSPTGIRWNNVTILKILRQEKYIGDIRWQKTYSVFMGDKWKINHGEENSYYIRNCLPPIISREDFAAAQSLMERNTRTPKTINKSPFRGKTKCTCGRSYSYILKGKEPIWECSAKYDQSMPCDNPVFKDSAYHRAWNRMCIKLRKNADEIILPCIAMLDELNESVVGEEITGLQLKYEELAQRRYVLCALCSQGCITHEKLVVSESEINAELAKIESRLDRLEKQSDESSDGLQTLYRLITKIRSDSLVGMILVNAVSDGTTIEFELIGGLKVREQLI